MDKVVVKDGGLLRDSLLLQFPGMSLAVARDLGGRLQGGPLAAGVALAPQAVIPALDADGLAVYQGVGHGEVSPYSWPSPYIFILPRETVKGKGRYGFPRPGH
jgi:hypothetical protein